MAKGFIALIGTLVVFNLALLAIGFALKYNRFPSGFKELFDMMF